MPASKQPNKNSVLMGDMTISQIISHINFEDEEVEYAARTLPKCLLEAVRYRVRIMRRRMEKGQTLDVTRVNVSQKIRAQAKRSGDKVTEGGVKELTELSPAVRKHQGDMIKLVELEEFAKLILECFRYKKTAITVVADMTNAEAAILRHYEAGDTKNTLATLQKKARDKYTQVGGG